MFADTCLGALELSLVCDPPTAGRGWPPGGRPCLCLGPSWLQVKLPIQDSAFLLRHGHDLESSP